MKLRRNFWLKIQTQYRQFPERGRDAGEGSPETPGYKGRAAREEPAKETEGESLRLEGQETVTARRAF